MTADHRESQWMPPKEFNNVATLQTMHDLAVRIFLLHELSFSIQKSRDNPHFPKIKDICTDDYYGIDRNALRDSMVLLQEKNLLFHMQIV